MATSTSQRDGEASINNEASPLLPNTTKDTDTRDVRHQKATRGLPALLCAFAFVMMLGDNLQPAALIQVFENVICDEYYSKNPLPPGAGDPDVRCKVHPVQAELAFVRGYQQLAPIFATLLFSVPYAVLANRIGRKKVLTMTGMGLLGSLSWVLAVCYWRFASIRWIWLSGIFLCIGGGEAVLSSMAHVMVTDAVPSSNRAQIFLYLHAADVVAGFFGPAISAPLMERGHTWTVLVIAVAVMFFGTFILTLAIPETLQTTAKSADHEELLAESPFSSPPTSRPESPSLTRKADQALDSMSHLLAPFISLFTSNPQAVLLILICGPQTAARDVFVLVGLQYSNTKFSLPYAKGNLLLSLFQGAQGVVVLLILPLITRFIAERRGWAAWSRDRLYAITSIGLTALGLLVIGNAPSIAVEVSGLLLLALGSCTSGLLMSLQGGVARPNQVSAAYSSTLMLSMVFRTTSGPTLSALLVKGMELGWKWMGLPFTAMALLMATVMLASTFIRREKPIEAHEE